MKVKTVEMGSDTIVAEVTKLDGAYARVNEMMLRGRTHSDGIAILLNESLGNHDDLDITCELNDTDELIRQLAWCKESWGFTKLTLTYQPNHPSFNHYDYDICQDIIENASAETLESELSELISDNPAFSLGRL